MHSVSNCIHTLMINESSSTRSYSEQSLPPVMMTPPCSRSLGHRRDNCFTETPQTPRPYTYSLVPITIIWSSAGRPFEWPWQCVCREMQRGGGVLVEFELFVSFVSDLTQLRRPWRTKESSQTITPGFRQQSISRRPYLSWLCLLSPWSRDAVCP